MGKRLGMQWGRREARRSEATQGQFLSIQVGKRLVQGRPLRRVCCPTTACRPFLVAEPVAFLLVSMFLWRGAMWVQQDADDHLGALQCEPLLTALDGLDFQRDDIHRRLDLAHTPLEMQALLPEPVEPTL